MGYWDDRGRDGDVSTCRFCGEPIMFTWQWRHGATWAETVGMGARGCNANHHMTTGDFDNPYDPKEFATPVRGWKAA